MNFGLFSAIDKMVSYGSKLLKSEQLFFMWVEESVYFSGKIVYNRFTQQYNFFSYITYSWRTASNEQSFFILTKLFTLVVRCDIIIYVGIHSNWVFIFKNNSSKTATQIRVAFLSDETAHLSSECVVDRIIKRGLKNDLTLTELFKSEQLFLYVESSSQVSSKRVLDILWY